MECRQFYFSGKGQCNALRDSIVAMIIAEKGTTITKALAATTAGWKALVAPSTGAKALIIDFNRGLEPATDEPEMVTSNVGYTELVNRNAPKFNGFGNMGYVDYQLFFAAEGKKFDIYLIDKLGNVIGTNVSDTTLGGFRGRFFLKSTLPAVGADLQKDMAFQVMFDNTDQWGDKAYLVKTDFDLTEVLEDINPIGLDLKVVTPYATGGDVTVIATLRGTNIPYAGLTTVTEWTVLSAAKDVGVVLTVASFAEAALGKYTLNIVKAAAADITGEVVIQGSKVASNFITHVTQPLSVFP